ncbi:DEAD/DEAH box helicase [Candidatus Kaiserbacteria bacterium]|nr:DEAD/DEAH box helicase [Candidatus Kaiserbacteria bacterium]
MPIQTTRRPQTGRRPYSGSGQPSRNSSFSRRPNNNSGGRSRFSVRPARGGNSGGGRSGGGARKMPSFDPSQFINKNPVEVTEEAYVPTHGFNDFGLHPDIVATVTKQGITSPSPIQDQVIPLILEGKDVIGLAETGTGKTAAFLLPLIQKTLIQKNQQTIILTPTRELALQAEAEFRKFGAAFKLYATSCVGGTSIRPQIRALKRNNHFIIGTPGRILDLIDRGDLRTDRINNVVLDEADRMLDMGFIHDMRKILENVTKNRQTLFF